MSQPMKCSQENCDEMPAYRYTWPGKDEAFICPDHMLRLGKIANALQMHLQIIPLTVEQMLAISAPPGAKSV